MNDDNPTFEPGDRVRFKVNATGHAIAIVKKVLPGKLILELPEDPNNPDAERIVRRSPLLVEKLPALED